MSLSNLHVATWPRVTDYFLVEALSPICTYVWALLRSFCRHLHLFSVVVVYPALHAFAPFSTPLLVYSKTSYLYNII